MREYKIRFSYLLNGERVYEYEYFVFTMVQEAVECLYDEYDDLSGLRIEQIWIDRNNRWESIEWEE